MEEGGKRRLQIARIMDDYHNLFVCDLDSDPKEFYMRDEKYRKGAVYKNAHMNPFNGHLDSDAFFLYHYEPDTIFESFEEVEDWRVEKEKEYSVISWKKFRESHEMREFDRVLSEEESKEYWEQDARKTYEDAYISGHGRIFPDEELEVIWKEADDFFEDRRRVTHEEYLAKMHEICLEHRKDEEAMARFEIEKYGCIFTDEEREQVFKKIEELNSPCEVSRKSICIDEMAKIIHQLRLDILKERKESLLTS
jgi:hypothetical protein